MLLFKLLILSHLIADFPLQFAIVYRAKLRSSAGHIFHALICLGSSALFGYPLLGRGYYWLFIIALAVAHLLIDAMKVKYLDCIAGPASLWIFLLDQALHIAAIATVLLTSLPASAGLAESALGELDHAGLITMSIFFIAGTFGGTYLLAAIKVTFFGAPAVEVASDGFSKYYGVIERGIIFLLIILGGFLFLLVPLVLAARLPVANRCAKKFKPRRFLLSPLDIAGSLLIACVSALAAIIAR